LNLRKVFIVGLFLVLFGFGDCPLVSEELIFVEVDLSAGLFKSNLPFDEEFVIFGNLHKRKDIEVVKLEYKIADGKRKKYHYFPPKEKPVEEFTWIRFSEEQQKFSFRVGPIHPNLDYEFKFGFFRKFKDDSKRSNIVNKRLNRFFLSGLKSIFQEESAGEISVDELNKFRVAINNQLKELGFLNYKGEYIKLDEKEHEFTSIRKNVLDSLTEIEDNYKNQKEAIEGLIDYFDKLREKQFEKNLSKILEKPDKLSPPFKTSWSQLINASTNSYIKMSEVALIVADGIREKELKNFLVGSVKIEGNSLCSAKKMNVDSITLLLNFFEKISTEDFKYGGNEIFKKVSDELKAIKTNLDDIIKYKINIDKAKRKLIDSSNSFSDLFRGALLDHGHYVTIGGKSKVTRSSKDSKYFGLDIGVGYAFEPGITFTYAAINYHFRPVNNNTPVSSYKNWDILFKRFSLFLGLSSIGVKEARYKNLFSGGSIVFGVGFRVNNLIKFNGGWLVFSQDDGNPIVEKDKTKFTLFSSLSLNINIKPLFDKLGKLF
jgi:hypothetical protein